jgi:PGF-pre-PGF domain-containing protein
MVWQQPNRVINPVVIILLVCALVSIVSADSVTPPGSITICGYVTYANEIGIWWFNPYDPDFGGVQMWLDEGYIGNTSSADHFYNAYSAVVGTHTFSTHTFDNSGNVNTTWVNLTFITKEYPGCTENWTCSTCSPPVAPVAAFSANLTSGLVPLAVQFTDNSTNTPTAWNWSFGDGNYSAIQNPEYTFMRAGSYSITLNVSNIAGYNSTTKVDYIVVIPQTPVASFTSNVTAGLAPLGVQFNDTSTNFPTMWNWSFGDTSWFNTTDPLLSNATKSYTTGGTYTVTLYVSNSGGSDNVSHSLDVWNRTTNDFVANVTSGNVTFPVLFNDTSYNATSWYWIFDGINTSTAQNPVFAYAVPGMYSVNHSSGNAHDMFWTNKSNYITAYPPGVIAPVAGFTGTPTSGTAPLAVQFTDQSTGSPTSWNWSFGDGNYSPLMSPSHTYPSAGVFTVSLNATNSAGSNLSTRSNYITVTSTIIPPTASFTGTPVTGAAPLSVQFTDTSNGSPTSWNWSFGDGSNSTARNPSHTYAVNGTYTVSLNATNAAGSNTVIRANYITVSATPPTVVPTLTSSNSDTPRFVPTTGGATESGVKAGERITVPFTGNLEADDSVPVVVVEISVIPSVDIQGLMVSAQKATPGSSAKIQGNPPAYYLDIAISWVREEAVKEGGIRFSVDEGWLKDQGITPDNLVMMRYIDSAWRELPTTREKYANGRYYYSATTTGFPHFAVTRRGAGVPTTIQTVTSLLTLKPQIKSESTTSTTTRATLTPVPKKPVTTTTTLPPEPPQESPEIPFLWIIFGVAGFIGLVIVIVFTRRWWIRRQNPALFRKYD